MLDIFLRLKTLVKVSHVHIDSSVFRLHWSISSVILLTFSVIVTTRQYVGNPIGKLQKCSYMWSIILVLVLLMILTVKNILFLSYRLHSYQRCARRRVRPVLLDPFHLYHPKSLVPACWNRGCPSGCHGLKCGWGRGTKIRVLLSVGWILSVFPSK